jgi:UDP-N-acetylglucosamine:LPS N-acetylglucosamine transferase
MSRISEITALQWPEQRELIPRGEVFGPMLARAEREPYDGGYILATGGTYGHRTLFEALDDTNLKNVVLQAGPYYSEEYVRRHPTWKVIDYSANFHELIAGAEVVVTHFGETIIDAALVYHKPTIISTNPDWTRTAGIEDASILTEKVNGVLLKEVTPDALLHAIDQARKKKPPRFESGAARLSQRIIEMAEKL